MKKLPAIRFILIPILIIFMTSCRHKVKPFIIADVAESEKVEVKIMRYEDALFQIRMSNIQNELKRLQKDYRFFLNADLNDTMNITQIRDFLNDPLIKQLYADCKKKYADVKDLEKQFSAALTYFHHFFPEKRIPRVYTYLSGLAYETPVKYSDSCLAVALDVYFGKNYSCYSELKLPQYMTKRMDRNFLVPDCLREMAMSILPSFTPGCTLLDRMIYEGKVLYFIDATLPEIPDTIKIGYSGEQLDWCNRNEGNIWSYLIENKLLYSTDYQSQTTFFGEGPFTSIFTKKSPARIGCYVGWQIVRNYMMNKKSATMKVLFDMSDSQQILNESGYHPKK